MSSDYYAICVNHDPAIALYEHEWGNPGEAQQAIAHRVPESPFHQHPSCDLLIGRRSGALIEIGCPPSEICRYHRDVEWVDVGWLRLLLAALKAGTDISGMRIPTCWSATRIKHLANILDT